MKPFQHGKTILAFSVPLVLLLVIASGIGLFTENFYSKETFNWQVQSAGQDMIDLFLIAPSLLVTAILAYRTNSLKSALLWAGAVLYTIYTFIIFCFSVHFNSLFLLYCFILGLSVYAAGWFFYTVIKRNMVIETADALTGKATGLFFIIIAVSFYFLWLAEIVPSMLNGITPASLIETGLITNPVHVLDLAVFLPATFITGILLVKKKPAGFLLAPVLLFFFILMNITIGWLSLLMNKKGITENISVAIAMMVLALISALLLVLNLRNFKINNDERS